MSCASEQPLWFPRHWPTWLGLAGFWLASQLPWPVQRGLARFLGAFAYDIVPIRRHVARVNLRLCFPEKTPAEIRALARALPPDASNRLVFIPVLGAIETALDITE